MARTPRSLRICWRVIRRFDTSTTRACASHPQHELARSQQSGFGAMLSFELHGGIGNVRAFLDGLQCFSLAESLGGVESLVAHPAT